VEPPPLLRDLPPNIQFQLAGFGPLLFGLVGGFLLGTSEVGYWIVQALGVGLGFAGGYEHRGAREGALRGLIAGTLFGLGIVLGDAISRDPPLAEVPDPVGVILIPIAIGGTVLGALGGRARARAG
jgi:hypothetical protein